MLDMSRMNACMEKSDLGRLATVGRIASYSNLLRLLGFVVQAEPTATE